MTTFSFYEAQRNSDQTEGRGSMVPIGRFIALEDALERVKGEGVMGVGDGEVVEVTYEESDGVVEETRTKIYGYRQGWNGKWGTGFIDNRDAPLSDPDYEKYLRLRKKFGI